MSLGPAHAEGGEGGGAEQQAPHGPSVHESIVPGTAGQTPESPATDAAAASWPHTLAEGFSDDELHDMAQVARQEGISLAEAIERIGWQGSFVAFVNDLAERYPDRYSGAGIVDGGRGAWIGFKGDAPGAVASRAAGFPVPVELIGGKGFSEQGLVEALERAYFALLGREDVADAAGGYDIRSGDITVSVLPSASLGPAARDVLRDRIKPDVEALRASLDPATPLSVEVVDRIDAELDATNMLGGGWLQEGVLRHCTAGFTVGRMRGGERGVSTAHHCARHPTDPWRWASLRYHRHGTSAFTDVARLGLAARSWGDLAWYSRGAYTPVPWFYFDHGRARGVNRDLFSQTANLPEALGVAVLVR